MEDRELQNIWKKLNPSREYRSKEDLKILLDSKTRKTVNKFLYHLIFSLVVSSGLTFFIIISTIQRWNDLVYRINNFILGSYTLLASMGIIWSMFKLKINKSNLPLKEWLEYQINILSGWVYNKTVYYIVPFLFVLVFFSIHFYYTEKTVIEVFSKEDFYGITFGFIIGLTVSFWGVFKVKKQQRSDLKFLENLYKIITNPNL